MIQEAIARVVDGTDLSREEASAVMHVFMQGAATPAQMGAFLVALRMKGETVEEITGFVDTMRACATHIQTKRSPLLDTCGTGGDRSGTFNISTAAAFVAAGAGVAVAKHGNRSASSLCGSADVLEELGVNIEASPECVGRCIDEVGIGFLYARLLHGSMKHVATVRQDLKLRTVFNILGPLTNPAGADRQIIGVFDPNLVEMMAQVLHNLGASHALVLHGNEGLDEAALSGPTTVAEARDDGLHVYQVLPEDFGLDSADIKELSGGDKTRNAEILIGVLDGCPGPYRDVTAFNAGAALYVGGVASDWREGIEIAYETIDSGAARAKLEGLIRLSNDS